MSDQQYAEIIRLRALNAELVAALEEIERLDDPDGACGEVARAVLAKAKGET